MRRGEDAREEWEKRRREEWEKRGSRAVEYFDENIHI